MLKFLGFLVFVIVATGAFFVIFALSVGAPFALKPDSKKEEEIQEESSASKE